MLRAFCPSFSAWPRRSRPGRRRGREGGRGGAHIEENDFGEERANDEYKQNPKEPVLVLRISGDPGDDGGAEALCRNDTESANPTAYGNIDEHVSVAPSRSSVKGGDG